MSIMIGLWLKKIGWFIWDHKIWFLLGLVLFLMFLLFRGCGQKESKPIDEKKLQEAIVAIEEKNDAKLKEILVAIEVEEKQIDSNVANAHADTWAATQNAREKINQMNRDEVQAEICKRYGC